MLDGILKILGYDKNLYKLKGKQILTNKHPDFKHFKIYWKGKLVKSPVAIMFPNINHDIHQFTEEEMLEGIKELEMEIKK